MSNYLYFLNDEQGFDRRFSQVRLTDGYEIRGVREWLGADPAAALPNTPLFILFSGHMIDKAGRIMPRFPPEKEAAASAAIRDAIRDLVDTRRPADFCGIAAAACGGDILFHEACRDMGVRSEVYLGIPVEEFEKTSVAFADRDWVERYRRLIRELPVHVLFPAMADVGDEVWEKANQWMLNAASDKGGMSLVVLWDGEGGEGPGGTKHMVKEAGNKGATIRIIDVHGL
jgi:hypothetical protein